MDETRFDTIIRRLAATATRRRMMGGLLGSVAILTGTALAPTDADAKRGKGKKKGKGKGKGKAHGKNKVTICHKNDDGSVVLKNVPSPALKGHLKHGDARCEVGVCQTGDPTCSEVEETVVCTFATAEDGTACEVGGVEGTCVAGVCETEPPVVEE